MNSVMLPDVARVKVSKDAIKLYNGKMTNKRRRKIREDLVINLIKDTPVGQRIKLRDFDKLLQFGKDGAVHAFLASMIKKGQILRHPIHEAPGKQYSYTAVGDIRLFNQEPMSTPEYLPITEAPEEAEAVEEVDEYQDHHHDYFRLDPVIDDRAAKTEKLAMEYFWNTQDNDLRNFINWLKEKN